MKNEKPWAGEPTPLCDQAEVLSWDADDTLVISTDRGAARDLERRLRHAARLLGTIRVDCMLDGSDGTLDPELLEQRLGELEEVFDPAQPT